MFLTLTTPLPLIPVSPVLDLRRGAHYELHPSRLQIDHHPNAGGPDPQSAVYSSALIAIGAGFIDLHFPSL